MPRKSASDKKPVAKTNGKAKVRFHYIKSSCFRVIHADGAWGGVTPQGQIHAALYNERTPIPQQLVHEIKPVGLGPEIKDERVTRDGIVREVEVDIIMSLDVARSLNQWLGQRIKRAEELLASAKQGKK